MQRDSWNFKMQRFNRKNAFKKGRELLKSDLGEENIYEIREV